VSRLHAELVEKGPRRRHVASVRTDSSHGNQYCREERAGWIRPGADTSFVSGRRTALD
jgi:hypothetical protein